MTIVGQFRDRVRSDRFVWVRGFPDMKRRHLALERFYGGSVWRQHSAAANATMMDVSDVHLLRPARTETSFFLDPHARPSFGEERRGQLVFAGIHRLRQPADAALLFRFELFGTAQLRSAGVVVESIFVTEPAPNTFSVLPVREGQHVLVWFATTPFGNSPTGERLKEITVALRPLAGESIELLESRTDGTFVVRPSPRSSQSLLTEHTPTNRVCGRCWCWCWCLR